MKVLDAIKKGLFFLDGAAGTYLQDKGLVPGELPEMWNLNRPEEIVALHKAYYAAGSQAVYTNTFGANALKYDGKEGRPTVEQVVRAAVQCAIQARNEITHQTHQSEHKILTDLFIGLDIGPLGRLLAPLGDMPFEKAVELFAEIVVAGSRAGADFIVIETMNDSYETKAALLAAKENSKLPVFVSNAYEEGGRLLSGTPPEAMVAMLEGLGADVIGINCSLGPEQMLDLVSRFYACASLPILVKPNAGLPHESDGKTLFDVTPLRFVQLMGEIVDRGAGIIGGCCGTTPEFISLLVEKTKDKKVLPTINRQLSRVSSYGRAVYFGEKPIIIGERINPTGKKPFKQALRDNNMGYVLKEAISQQEEGAHVLDVNVGLPGIDEAAMLETCVGEIQGVCDLPLQLDTSNPVALEKALRIYNGKAMINSVNGSQESMDAVFPLVAKYGGMVVCLTLDESGIPETAQGRLAIAKGIANKAADYGIGIHDLIFDPLAMTISSEKEAAKVVMEAISLIKDQLGAHTILGVSNISFGLPSRDAINATFFTMALSRGLSAAIMNPFSLEMQKSYHAYLALTGQDESCLAYIDFAQNLPDTSATSLPPFASKVSVPIHNGLKGAILRGLSEEATRLSIEALKTRDPMALIDEEIVPALNIVGQDFEDKVLFLPQLLMSAEAAKAAFQEIRQKVPAAARTGNKVILATVQGDIHDIGKNIVKAIMENYGFSIIDLGRDVAAETLVEAAREEDVQLVGLSALMTTTVPYMEKTILELKKQNPNLQVMVGGAVLTESYARKIGADFYGKTAMEAVRYAKKLYK